MTRQDSFKEFVLDQLAAMESVTCRAMFGGFGLYRQGVFFGILHKGRLYFKTNDQTRPAYEEYGMLPVRPWDKQTLKDESEVPPVVLDGGDGLGGWAEQVAGR